MFWRVLARVLRHRWDQLAVAMLAVLLGTALISALANLSFDMATQTGRELRAYGANILVLPRAVTPGLGGLGEEQGIPERDLATLDGIPDIFGYAPYLYLATEVQGQPVVIAGVAFERLQSISPWWEITGRWPSAPGEALVGAASAKALALKPGQHVTVGLEGVQRELEVVGLVQAGGAEDNQILVPLPLAQALGGRPGQVGLVQVSALASSRPAAEVAAAIAARLPNVQARPLRQFAQAEEVVLSKIRLLMALVAAMVLGVAALAVGSSMATGVLERRTEIGLMKALGAAQSQVAALFLAESLSIGAVGGFAGYLVGLGVAALIGFQVFHARLNPNPFALPVSLAVALGVVLVASVWPVHRAMSVEPAMTLRGE